ncbi:hypothetical protein ACLOJK_019273 [Asimina triloba]
MDTAVQIWIWAVDLMEDCCIVAGYCGLLMGVLAGAMVARVGRGGSVAVHRWIEMADGGRVLRWVSTHLDDGYWLASGRWCWHAAAVDRVEEVLVELLSGVMGSSAGRAAGGRGDGWDGRTVLIDGCCRHSRCWTPSTGTKEKERWWWRRRISQLLAETDCNRSGSGISPSSPSLCMVWIGHPHPRRSSHRRQPWLPVLREKMEHRTGAPAVY